TRDGRRAVGGVIEGDTYGVEVLTDDAARRRAAFDFGDDVDGVLAQRGVESAAADDGRQLGEQLIQRESALYLFEPHTLARDDLFKNVTNVTHNNSGFPQMRLRWLRQRRDPASWRSDHLEAGCARSARPRPVRLLTRSCPCRRRKRLNLPR